MKRKVFYYILGALAFVAVLALSWPSAAVEAQDEPQGPLIVGKLQDSQSQPVSEAVVTLSSPQSEGALAEAETQPNGQFTLAVPETHPDQLSVTIERTHFVNTEIELSASDAASLRSGETLVLPDTVLQRRIDASFWIATVIFILMLILIATGRLHNTLAALVGASLVFAVSYLGSALWEELFIFNFTGALEYVDWNVIFLIMGMMIVIATVERTGVFQWVAFFAYRISGGRTWLLVPILMIATGLASAFLDNVTTMLLMTPITIQIAMALGLTPWRC